MSNGCFLTVEGKKALEEEKKNLLEEQRGVAKNLGKQRLKKNDCNSGFIADNRGLQTINRKIKKINRLLKEATVIDSEDIPNDCVAVGCEVVVCFPSGEEVDYVIGVKDPDKNNVISPEAPLGKEIIGCKEGDIITYFVNGKKKEVKIKNIK